MRTLRLRCFLAVRVFSVCQPISPSPMLLHAYCCACRSVSQSLCDPVDCSPAPLSFTVSWSLLIFMSLGSVMLSTQLILCHPLLPLPSSHVNIGYHECIIGGKRRLFGCLHGKQRTLRKVKPKGNTGRENGDESFGVSALPSPLGILLGQVQREPLVPRWCSRAALEDPIPIGGSAYGPPSCR